ncbi:hypothetical protein [Metabacillus fastidiosus]|uniref:hypothetical protein n=1 Tax=Metabacillus fastidiosus TaxID=1458 RepID=UPI003D292128
MKKFPLSFFIIFIFLVGCSNINVLNSNEDKSKYRDELKTLVPQILNNSVLAENMIKIYSTLWDYSLDSYVYSKDIQNLLKISEYEVEEYFGSANSNGEIFTSFEKTINGANQFYEDEDQIKELETNSETISKKLQELNNPPQEYQDVYDKVLELYLLHEEYIDMAISPNGSLMSYNQKVNELSSKISNKINEIDVIMPDNDKK